MKLVIALIALSGCSAVKQYECVTKCGIYLNGNIPGMARDGWSCGELQRFEDRFTEEFASNYVSNGQHKLVATQPLTKESVCKAIGGQSGLEVYVQATPEFFSGGREVVGLTWCDWHVSQIGLSRDPFTSALPHELAHWLDRCNFDRNATTIQAAKILKNAVQCVAESNSEDAIGVCQKEFEHEKDGLGQFGYHAFWDELGINGVILKMVEHKDGK